MPQDASRAWRGWAVALVTLAVAVKLGALRGVDEAVRVGMTSWHAPLWDRTAAAVTCFGNVSWVLAASAIMSGWWVWRRAWRRLATFAAAGLGGFALQVILRCVVAQWRPDTVLLPASMTLLDRFELAGFPSGHAYRAGFLYGWWAQGLSGRRPFDVAQGGALSAVEGRRFPGALAAVLGCWALLVLVGLSRLYLNRHWLTDVIGAWLLAGLVLAAAAWRVAKDTRWTPRCDRLS